MRKILVLIALTINCLSIFGEKEGNTNCMFGRHILDIVSEYANSIVENNDTAYIYAHTRFNLSIEKKNLLLYLIPSMYNVAHGNRHYTGESTYGLKLKGFDIQNITNISNSSTIPNNKKALSILSETIFPKLYNETIYDGFLLSPFCKYNFKLYEYHCSELTGNRVEIAFCPKIKNTQLISGTGIVDKNSGKIISLSFMGELDLIKIQVRLIMSNSLRYGYIPKSYGLRANFSFIGNRITTQNHCCFTISEDKGNADACEENVIEKTVADNEEDYDILKKIYTEESALRLKDKDLMNNVLPNKAKRRKSNILNLLGDCFFNDFSYSWGENSNGKFKLSPIINPLYIGYSSKKGVTYKLRLNGSYIFTDTKNISITVNAGYSFKQRQFYTRIPLRLTLSKKIYLESVFGSGDRITNSEILSKIKHESYDSIRWKDLNLEYFKDMYWKFRTNLTIAKRWNIRPGVTLHRRSAVDKKSFYISGKPARYLSFSPTLQVQFQPFLSKDLIFSVDYARGIKGVFKSDMNYERFETDMSWKNELYKMRALSFRVGYGLYTSRSEGSYFLDYSNFKYENIQGGWNDDWTGEFQLLNSNWYNASKFYLRSNLTYEAPLMLVSRLPIVGKYIEMERIYTNFLFTDKLHPYLEYGYGFTNRIFSTGIFFSVSNKKIDGFGMKFGIEMFRDW